MSIYDVFSGGGRPFNKEEWAAQKQEQRKAAYELIDTTCEKMMADGGAFQQYLDVQGHFDRYDYNDAEEQLMECKQYTVEDLFCCGYAKYFWQAVKVRYPEYC